MYFYIYIYVLTVAILALLTVLARGSTKPTGRLVKALFLLVASPGFGALTAATISFYAIRDLFAPQK